MTGISKGTYIPTIKNKLIKVEELKQGDTIYALSKEGNIVEDKVKSVDKVEDTSKQILMVEFYNNSYITLSPEQEMITLEGKSRKAEKIDIGEHVMPFNLKEKNNIQAEFNPDSYFIVKRMKRIDKDELYQVQTKGKQQGICVVTSMVKDSTPNDFGGCFVKS